MDQIRITIDRNENNKSNGNVFNITVNEFSIANLTDDHKQRMIKELERIFQKERVGHYFITK